MILHWNFWVVAYQTENHWLVYSPDLDLMTQASSLENCRTMAEELIFNHLHDNQTPVITNYNPTALIDPAVRNELSIPDVYERIRITLPITYQAALIFRHERLEHGLTIERMAEILETTSRTICRWEAGTHDIPFRVLDKVLQYFGKTPCLVALFHPSKESYSSIDWGKPDNDS